MLPAPVFVITMQDGDVVELHYIGRVKRTGDVFDLTDPDVADEEGIDTSNMDLGPVKILLGEGYLLEGLEDKIKEMDVGDSRTISLSKEEAFGSRESSEIRTISEREFKEHDVRPRRGMQIEVDGQQGKILTVSNGRVKVDFNHPLAGQDLEYDVEILREVNELEEQVEAVVEFHLSMDYGIGIEDGDVTITIGDSLPDQALEQLENEIEKLEGVATATVTSE